MKVRKIGRSGTGSKRKENIERERKIKRKNLFSGYV
jgi:hypothetical protein